MTKNKKPKPKKELIPITVYICAAGLGIIGYFIGEFVLNSGPHPLHWVGGIVGVGFGYLLGKALVSRVGDIFGF